MKSFFRSIVVAILTWEARLMLLKYDPGIVAVTGNVGKTSTKDAVAYALASFSGVRKSEKSYNSEIGLPLTVLGLKTAWDNPFAWVWNLLVGAWRLVWPRDYPEWIVLEVGADRPGDIEKLAAWLKTDIVIITQVGEIPVHVAYFDSPEEVAKEKAHLLATLRPGGVAILNADDKRVMAMKTPRHARVMTIGFTEDADLAAVEPRNLYDEDGVPEGVACKIVHAGSFVPVVLHGVVGFQQFYAVLAACAAAIVRGGNLVQIIESLKDYESPRGRLRLIKGKYGSVLLDDTYNASPKATEAALQTLSSLETKGRKIAIVGDMKELGSYSRRAHDRVGSVAAKSCDELVVVGEAAQGIGNAALDGGLKTVLRFKDSRSAADALIDYPKGGDIILVKGSQSMRMERIVEALMAHPERKETLLVRQDPEWQER